MKEISNRSGYTEIVTHGAVIFSEKEVVEALMATIPVDDSPVERPKSIEGQEGWQQTTKLNLSMDGDEVVIGFRVVWTKGHP